MLCVILSVSALPALGNVFISQLGFIKLNYLFPLIGNLQFELGSRSLTWDQLMLGENS